MLLEVGSRAGADRLQEQQQLAIDPQQGQSKAGGAFKSTGSQVERDKDENCLTCLVISLEELHPWKGSESQSILRP